MKALADQGSDRVQRHEERITEATAEYVEGKHGAADAARRAAEPTVEEATRAIDDATARRERANYD